MAPQKRKRQHDAELELPRRATRQHPSPNNDEHLLRSGRVRAGSIRKPYMLSRADRISEYNGEVKKRVGRPPSKQNRATAGHVASDTVSKENSRPNNSNYEEEEQEDDSIDELAHSPENSSQQKRKVITKRPPIGSPPPQTRLIPPKSPLQHQHQHQQVLNQSNPQIKPSVISTPKRPTTSDKPLKPPPTPRSDRNIDKVVLGNICFKAWYPSYYGKEVLGDISNHTSAGGKDGRDGGGKIGGRIGGGKRQPPPMLERLYVCPCCFKYSRELVAWWEHVRCCEKSFEMPGQKVYTHPKGLGTRTRTVNIPSAFSSSFTTIATETAGKGKGRKRSDGGAAAGASTVEEMVSDNGEWSVWEVDGEKDRLFCQNLSLFAKLFLDNKSVFFDVTGFNYFLLVYTPPPPTPDSQSPPEPTIVIPNSQSSVITAISAASQHTPTSQTRPQVVGFFSKEKLSWDNNNLACILVFPPWQRKGLGALLMGVSYEISRREGILGGPEKPISELGRKGYKRFWAGEIARWLLELKIPNEGRGEEASKDKEKEKEEKEKETEVVITVEDVSKATWIVPEDCLAVLREMDVVEDASPGSGSTGAAITNGSTERRGGSISDGDAEAEESLSKAAPRVRLDREAVRRWISANKIDLTKTCDPDGFVEGYAVKEGGDEEADEG
ncbi:acyl-CoA N-acyltransferase [Daldinia caldariorum]|uniref:acyl-CoA N-acyltransferase n=1 Tax=Daldinia caldariorum TaxID=326644 RepID=UPI002007692D|nr:acyl-CoA N-acyltransferase [Daldinia caldariorum]KAI1468244.1 acyl-CoA N-acyltransferase [Daldinia caldariorum]